jgi:hypothetical protein
MNAPLVEKPIVAPVRSREVPAGDSWKPFVAALLVIALGAVALVYFRAHQKLGAPGVKVVAVPLRDESGKPMTTQSVPLPEHVLDFHSKPMTISEDQLKQLPADTTYGRRGYWLDNAFIVSASVVLMGADRTSIHKPEFCLPSNGFRVETRGTDEIQIDSPRPYRLPVMKWRVSLQTRDSNGRPATYGGLYIFWFVADNELTREHSGRMLSIAKRMLAKGELQRWAYVSYLVTCAPGGEEAAYAKVKPLIAASVPQFQLATGPSTRAK